MDTLNWRLCWRLWMMVAVIAVVTFVLAFFASLAEASGCRSVTIISGATMKVCTICTDADGNVTFIQCV